MWNYLTNTYPYQFIYNWYAYFFNTSTHQPLLLEGPKTPPKPATPPAITPPAITLTKPKTPPAITPPLVLKEPHNFYYLSLFRDSEGHYTIHGLWPQTSPTEYPTYCHPVEFSIDMLSPILDQLEQYWYSQKHTLPLDEKFWQHEYSKHGSCVFTPMTELEYFQHTIDLYESALALNLPQIYYNSETKKCLIPVDQKLKFILPPQEEPDIENC